VTAVPVDVRQDMKALLDGQAGGVLATMGPAGDIHLVFVLCAATDALDILFTSDRGREHSRNIFAHPHATMLFDTRARIDTPALFHRIEARGPVEVVSPDDTRYVGLAGVLAGRHALTRAFLDNGCDLFCMRPEVLTFMQGGAKTVYRRADDSAGDAP
jgi:hypothetical protein